MQQSHDWTMVSGSRGLGAGSKDLRQLIREFEKRGWDIALTGGGHYKWQWPRTGRFFFSSQTPSCMFAVRKIRQEAEKIEKADGLKENPRPHSRGFFSAQE